MARGDGGAAWERGRPARKAALGARFAGPASLSESGFTGLAGFSGFQFARIALFAITGNPAETNGGRLRAFVRIRICGICGIYRIFDSPRLRFPHNRKSRRDE